MLLLLFGVAANSSTAITTGLRLLAADTMATVTKHATPPPRQPSVTASLFVTILLMASSALLSGYITSTILDQEYKIIFAEIQKDCHRSQNEFLTCRSHLAEETNAWRIYADQNIRACQEYVERYLGEAISAYRLGSDGLSKAINNTESTLANSNEILNQELETLEKERAKITRQLQNSLIELETAEKDLELRDLDRAECDTNHRALITCEETLIHVAQQDMVNSEASSSRMLQQLSDQVQALKDQGKKKEAMVEEMGFTINNAEKEIQLWKVKAESIIEKINFRSRRDVLKQYGPGPHYVRITLSMSTSPTVSENILLKLAPLGMMSHTIQVFMNLVEEKMYVGGTFLLAHDHILVAGPIDAFDPENNQRLEEQMVEEGYFPDGALMFHQYTPDFPHRQYTVGFTSRGGPLFYINIEDNMEAHGPRHIESEGDVEGDPVFATVVEGFDVIHKIHAMPRHEDDSLETRVQIVDTYVMKIDVNLLGMQL